jgi:hypothetical protein
VQQVRPTDAFEDISVDITLQGVRAMQKRGPAGKTLVRKVGVPAALQIGAALATSGSSLPWQVGANVASGEVGRRIAGEEPWKMGGPVPFKDESGWLQDLLLPMAPFAVNTGVGITNSLAKPLLKVRAPDLVEAVNDIEMLATNLSRKVWQKIAILQAATLGQFLRGRRGRQKVQGPFIPGVSHVRTVHTRRR